MLQLYKNIKSRRIELNMTQSDLASKMGYADKSMIAKIEKGVIDLPQSKIIAFAKVLNTAPGILMGLDGTSVDLKVSKLKYMVELLQAFHWRQLKMLSTKKKSPRSWHGPVSSSDFESAVIRWSRIFITEIL